MRAEPTRAQLQEALRLAGVYSMHLDDALANPVLSRLLHIGASAMASQRPHTTSLPPSPLPAWAQRLRNLAGNHDYQRLRAGDND